MSASPEKRDKVDHKRNKRQRSKSEIVHRNNAAELIEDTDEAKAAGSNKDKNPKEVTIAKLGPFKMSLEVKNNEQRVDEAKTRERKKHSRAKDEGKKLTSDEKPPGEKTAQKRKKSRSKSEHRPNKSDELKKSENKVVPTSDNNVKKPENVYDEIKTEAEYLKYEHQISTESKHKSNKKKKDKIVVSKLAKSDRPLREKSPEKVVKVESLKKTAADKLSDGEDENSKSRIVSSAVPGLGKYSRSASQPGPAPDSTLLSSDAQIGLKRNLSLIIDEKEKPPKLKRSSTARDSFTNTGTMKHSRAKIVESLTENSSCSSGGGGARSKDKTSLYDNLGFDSSPDLGQAANHDKRQQSLLQLKDQIHSQLIMASAAASTNSSGKDRRRKLNSAFFPIPDEALANSDDDSDDVNRESPPTQIQSLSEESSGSSTRRKKSKTSSDSIKFDTSEEESEGEVALVGLGLVHNSLPRNSSQAQLLQSDSSDSVDDDFQTVPVYASNPHVKIPQDIPVPVPRTSLAPAANKTRDNVDKRVVGGDDNLADCDNGCDSDSTIDIRIRDTDKKKSKKMLKESTWTVSELDPEDEEDWEVREDSSDDNDDNITDIDTTSIITDGIAQQMMY